MEPFVWTERVPAKDSEQEFTHKFKGKVTVENLAIPETWTDMDGATHVDLDEYGKPVIAEWIRFTLHPSDLTTTLTVVVSGPTDEGSSGRETVIRQLDGDWDIFQYTASSDCDGHYSSESYATSKGGDPDHPTGISPVVWGKHSERDYRAESMGY